MPDRINDRYISEVLEAGITERGREGTRAENYPVILLTYEIAKSLL